MGYGETRIFGQFVDSLEDLEYVAFSHSAPNIVGYSSHHNTFSLYDFNKLNSLQNRLKLESTAKSFCFNYDNLYCALGLENGDLKVIQLDINKFVYDVKSHDTILSGVDFHPYSKLLVSSSLDNWIKIWDMRNNQCFRKIYLKNLNEKSRVKFSPDGSWLCCTCTNQTVILDIASGKPLHLFSHESNMSLIEYHPTELMIAAMCSNAVQFWDLDEFSEISTLSFPENNLSSCTFHQDGSCIFAGTTSGKIMAFGWETDDFCYNLNSEASNIYDIFHSDNKIHSIAAINNKLTLFNTSFEISENHICDTDSFQDQPEKIFPSASSANRTFEEHPTFSLSTESKYNTMQSLSITELNTPETKEIVFKQLQSSPICDSIMHEFTVIILIFNFNYILMQVTQELDKDILITFEAAHQKISEIIKKRTDIYISINRMLKNNNLIGAIKTAEDFNNYDISKELIKNILNAKNFNKDFPYIPLLRFLKQILITNKHADVELLNDVIPKIGKMIQPSNNQETKRNIDEKVIYELEALNEYLNNQFIKTTNRFIKIIILILSRILTRCRT